MKKTKSPLIVFKGATKDKTTLQPANLCYFIRTHLKNASWGWVLIIEFQQPTGGENEGSGSAANLFEPRVVCGQR